MVRVIYSVVSGQYSYTILRTIVSEYINSSSLCSMFQAEGVPEDITKSSFMCFEKGKFKSSLFTTKQTKQLLTLGNGYVSAIYEHLLLLLFDINNKIPIS